MDYTNKVGIKSPKETPSEGTQIHPAQAKVASAPQTERVIRDPGPRIISKDKYEEIQQQLAEKNLNKTVVMNPLKRINKKLSGIEANI